MNEVLFSGVKPSGDLQLGNYLGAIRNWVHLQNENEGENYFSIVDLHAITVEQDPEELRRRSLEVAKLFVAAGIDPQKSALFIQSHVSAHSELAWLLNCYTHMGELNKMTQFKDKAEGQANVSVGLFNYPVLMAADVLLYNTTKIPVGEDQIQHVELARDIAKRVNNRYAIEIFEVPDYVVNTVGARIMGLQNPEKKMSKSDGGEKNLVYLLDDPATAKKKIKSAVTDDLASVKYDPANQPGISNLLEIYTLLIDAEMDDVLDEVQNMQYGEFKEMVGNAVEEFLINLQREYNSISDEDILAILAEGAAKAELKAQKKVDEFKNLIGFINK